MLANSLSTLLREALAENLLAVAATTSTCAKSSLPSFSPHLFSSLAISHEAGYSFSKNSSRSDNNSDQKKKKEKKKDETPGTEDKAYQWPPTTTLQPATLHAKMTPRKSARFTTQRKIQARNPSTVWT